MFLIIFNILNLLIISINYVRLYIYVIIILKICYIKGYNIIIHIKNYSILRVKLYS